MSDLSDLRRILGQGRLKPDDWKLRDEPGADHVLAYGCPDGNGAYLQALFDERGKLIEAEIIESTGDPCRCRWCQPAKKRRKR